MTHPYLLALGVGYALDQSGISLQDLFDEMFGLRPEDQPPPGFRIIPEDDEPVEVVEEEPGVKEVIEQPGETEVIPEPEPPFVDPFIPDLDILPPELTGPIPEEVLEAAREKYGPSSELGPLGLPSPFEGAEEVIPGFVAPPLEVFVKTILPAVRRAPTLQALIRPADTSTREIAPTIAPMISPMTLSRTAVRSQFASISGLRAF